MHGRTCEKHVQRFDSLLPSGTSPLVGSTPLTLRSTLSSRWTVMLRMPSKSPPLSRSLSVKAAWQRALEQGQGLSSTLARISFCAKRRLPSCARRVYTRGAKCHINACNIFIYANAAIAHDGPSRPDRVTLQPTVTNTTLDSVMSVLSRRSRMRARMH